MAEEIKANTASIMELNNFRYKAVGILVVGQLVAAAGMKFIFDLLLKAQAQ